MNSTPADSRARRTARSFAEVIEVSFSALSALLIVASPREASRARSVALHLRSPRAALICALVRGRDLLVDSMSAHTIPFGSHEPNIGGNQWMHFGPKRLF